MEKERYIHGQSEVQRFSRHSLQQQGPLHGQLFQHGVRTLSQARLIEATAQHLTFDMDPRELDNFLCDNKIHVTLTWHHHHVYFTTHLGRLKGNSLVTRTPISLWLYDKRNSVRRQFEPGQAHVNIRLPHRPDKPLRWQILDISDTGLAFIAPIAECHLLPGTPIPELQVEGEDGNPTVHRGTVMHVTPLTKEQLVKVGVKFDRPAITLAQAHIHQSSRQKARWSWFNLGYLFRWLRTTPQENDLQVGPEVHTRFESLVGSNGQAIRIIHQNQTTSRELKSGSPTIIIAPGLGRTIESYGGLALTLIDAFASHARPVTVIRYEDGQRQSLASCHAFTLSQWKDNLRDVLKYVHDNLPDSAGPVLLITHDYQCLVARKFLSEDGGRHVDLWLAMHGVQSTEEQINRSTGGVDILGRRAKYGQLGPISLAGTIIDGDLFIKDAQEAGYIGSKQARQEIAQIPIPILWFRAEDDPFLDVSATRDLFLSTGATHGRDLVLLAGWAAGPNAPLAASHHREITGRLWQALHRTPKPVVSPSRARMTRHLNYELAQSTGEVDRGARHTWRRLLDHDQNALSIYYILGLSPAFEAFNRQFEGEMRKTKGSVLAFGQPLGAPDGTPWKTESIKTTQLPLELSPLATITNFINGDLPGYQALDGLQGIPQHAIQEWHNWGNDWRLWQLLRGRMPSESDHHHLAKILTPAALEGALEVGRCIRMAQGENERPDGADSTDAPRFWDQKLPLSLDLDDKSHDHIAIPLFPAHEDSLGLLSELNRALKIEGKLQLMVLATYSDFDRLEADLLQRIHHDPSLRLPDGWLRPEVLEEARQKIQGLRRMALLAERRVFKPMGRDVILDLMAQAGFEGIEIDEIGPEDGPIGYWVRGIRTL